MPYLFMPEATSYTFTEGSDARLTCYLLYGTENNQSVRWSWKGKGIEIDQADNVLIESTDQNKESTLHVKNVPSVLKGDYVCTASNAYGSHSRDFKLRVKGRRLNFI